MSDMIGEQWTNMKEKRIYNQNSAASTVERKINFAETDLKQKIFGLKYHRMMPMKRLHSKKALRQS
jgi:hypothetical protein